MSAPLLPHLRMHRIAILEELDGENVSALDQIGKHLDHFGRVRDQVGVGPFLGWLSSQPFLPETSRMAGTNVGDGLIFELNHAADAMSWPRCVFRFSHRSSPSRRGASIIAPRAAKMAIVSHHANLPKPCHWQGWYGGEFSVFPGVPGASASVPGLLENSPQAISTASGGLP